jgi:hypothetical protein
MIERPASSPYVDAPILEGMDDVDHWSPEAARRRLAMLATELPMAIPSDERFCGGASNDVWDCGDTFLKVCWRADRSRMMREVLVLETLPPEIPRASVLASGSSEELGWLFTSRVFGAAFFDVAGELPPSREGRRGTNRFDFERAARVEAGRRYSNLDRGAARSRPGGSLVRVGI